MIAELQYPTIEKSKPEAVSIEANSIRNNYITSHNTFIGASIYVKTSYVKSLKYQFDTLKSIWLNETLFSSSTTEINNNRAYRAIIDLGRDVIPFIIDDLRIMDNHWFYALEILAGVNPVKNENIGNIPAMKKDWLQWAEDNNL